MESSDESYSIESSSAHRITDSLKERGLLKWKFNGASASNGISISGKDDVPIVFEIINQLLFVCVWNNPNRGTLSGGRNSIVSRGGLGQSTHCL